MLIALIWPFTGNQSPSISIFPFWTIEMGGKKNIDRCAAGIKISEDLMLLPLRRLIPLSLHRIGM